MRDKGPKSAYELAMEKLKARDRERGVTEDRPLSESQKKRIAEVRSQTKAKLAELEIMQKSERMKIADDPEAHQKADREYVAERKRIDERGESQIEKIRQET